MAGLRVELLLVLVVLVLGGPLLALSAPDFEWPASQLLDHPRGRQWGPEEFDGLADFDNEDEEPEEIPDFALPEAGAPAASAASATSNSNADTYEVPPVAGREPASPPWNEMMDRGYEVTFDEGPRTWSDDTGSSWEANGLEFEDLDSDSTDELNPRATKEKCAEGSKAQNCDVPSAERVPCGESGISTEDCEKKGCCADSTACYYPMDECTADHHFVFAIRYDSAKVALDPTQLVVPGHPNCKPVLVNDKFAIYKISTDECGVRSYEIGETKIYLAEVQTLVRALNLKYGIISRSDPFRFLVECRYSKDGSAQKALASIGFMVKIPSSNLPASVINDGLFGVQLRMAKDSTYSSYLPTYHQPLRLLLGNKVYLELRLKSPVPRATIIVNYCLAYPRSAKNALVMIYEGCANPFDLGVSVLKVSDLPQNRYQRRFSVSAFQFMDQKTNKYLDEEIYFMCSAEVCLPLEKTCEQRCFDGKTP